MNFCGLSNLFFVGFMVGFPVSLWADNDLIGLLAGLTAAGLLGGYSSLRGNPQSCPLDVSARQSNDSEQLGAANEPFTSIVQEDSHDSHPSNR